MIYKRTHKIIEIGVNITHKGIWINEFGTELDLNCRAESYLEPDDESEVHRQNLEYRMKNQQELTRVTHKEVKKLECMLKKAELEGEIKIGLGRLKHPDKKGYYSQIVYMIGRINQGGYPRTKNK